MVNPPGARVRSPRNSSTAVGQGSVMVVLDAQDHGMVTCAFPKSIGNPGIVLPLLLLPIQCAKKQQSSWSRDGGTSMSKGTDPAERGGPILGCRWATVEGQGSRWDSSDMQPPYEAFWVACAPIILHCCTGSDVEPRLVLWTRTTEKQSVSERESGRRKR